MSTENTHLLSSNSHEDVTSKPDQATNPWALNSNKFKRNQVKRILTVEPLALFVIASTSCASVTTQYVYNSLAQEFNYTSYSVSGGSICNENTTDDDTEKQGEVQRVATMYNMVNTAIFLLPMIFSSIFVGPYTDKAGRKYGLIPAMVFCTLRLVGLIVIVAAELPLYSFFLANFVGGLAGGTGGLTMTCIAYIADITTSEDRTIRMFIFQSVLMIGSTIVVFGLSLLIVYIGFLNSYLCILGILIPIMAYTIFFLPETVIRQPDAKLFTLHHFKGAWRLYAKKTGPPRTSKLVLLVIITVLGQVTMQGSFETFTLYFFNQPFCWNTVMVSLLMAVFLLVMGVGGMILIPLTSRFLKDEGRLVLGSVFGIAFFILLALAYDTTTAFLACLCGTAISLTVPIAKSAATKIVQPHEQGQLQATINPLEQTVQFIFSWVNNLLYAASLQTIRGLQYFVAAGCMAIVLILALCLKFVMKGQKEHYIIIKETTVEESDLKKNHQEEDEISPAKENPS